MIRTALVASLLLFGCADGCSGPSTHPYPSAPPPEGRAQSGAVRIHLTNHALDAVRRLLPALLTNLGEQDQDGNIRIQLDEDFLPPDAPLALFDGCVGENTVPCAEPSFESALSIDPGTLTDGLTLAWVSNAATGAPGIAVAFNGLEFSAALGFAFDVDSLGSAACVAQDPPERRAIHLDQLSFVLDLTTSAEQGLTLTVRDVAVEIGGDASGVVALDVGTCDSGDCVSSLCGSDCAELCGLVDLFGELGGFIDTILTPVLDAVAPTLATAISDALAASVDALPNSFEDRLELADLSQALSHAHPLAYATGFDSGSRLSGEFEGRGLELPLSLATMAPTAAPCTNIDAALPSFPETVTGELPSTGFIEASDSAGNPLIKRYDLAVSVAESALQQSVFSLYRSGAICLRLDSETISTLSGGSFELSAGFLASFDSNIAHVAPDDAPILLTLDPRAQPEVNLGAGAWLGDGHYESLISLRLPDIVIGVYFIVDDRPIRVTGIASDLILALDIGTNPDGSLTLVASTIEASNLREIYNELAPEADLEALIEVVVDLAFETVFDNSANIPIDLDGLAGGLVPEKPVVVALRRETTNTDVDFVTLHLALCSEAQESDASDPTCYRDSSAGRSLQTTINLGDQDLSYDKPSSAYDIQWQGVPNGDLEFVGDESLEFQFRVDGGTWSRWRRFSDGRAVVHSPRLRLLGPHRVESRLRKRQWPGTARRGPTFPLWSDREHPKLSWRITDGSIAFSATDRGSPDAIRLMVKSAFSVWPSERWQFESGDLSPGTRVYAVDAAGNRSREFVVGGHSVEENAPHTGCSQGAVANGWLWLGLAVFFRRRNLRSMPS